MEATPKIDLSIVVPIYNESGNLPELYSRTIKAIEGLTDNYELIFVNDASKDNSLEIIQNYCSENNRVKYINFSRNFGHQQAITAGMQFSNGQAVVTIDGDLQDPPELIAEIYQAYQTGFPVVYAKRTSRKGEGFFKKITAYLFYRLLAAITNVKIPMDTGDFRLVDKKVVTQIKQMQEPTIFLRGLIAWTGYKHTFVEFERDSRKHGTTGYSIKKMVRLSLDAITGFSDLPLKLASLLGFVVSFVAFVIILYALYSKFILNQVVTGWTSLLISTMFIGGVQLLALGLIGEYISRINSNVRKRPNYIVENTNITSQNQSEE